MANEVDPVDDGGSAPKPPGAAADEEWLRNVYRAGERQFTFRAIAFGCVIGSVLSAANLYTGFTIGWVYGASISAAITAWVVFRAWEALAKGPHFTVLENNTMQTAASAAAAMAGAGMVNAVPALMVLTGRQLGFWETAAWLTSVAFLGICFAIPLKRQMINVEKLRFPSGMAAAETTLALHGEGEGGAAKAKALFGAAGLGALLNFVRDGLEWIPDALPRAGLTIGAHAMGKLTLQLNPSLLNVGAGALIGLRTTAWMALGATVCWAGVVPWVIDHGFLVPKPGAANYYMGGLAKWTMWPGVTMLVVGSLASFAFRARSIVTALRSLSALKGSLAGGSRASAEGDPRADVEIPLPWFFRGLAAAALLCVVTQYVVFGMPVWQTLIAIALSGVLALVGTRVTGETDISPIGAMGKVTQLVFAALAPQNPQANLMAAGITSAGAYNCSDLMQDLKTGRILGASPRKQLLAQLFGIVTGSLFTVLVFIKAFPVELIGTKYPAPSVITWKGMAELLTKGLGNLPPYTPQAMAVAAVLALVFTLAGELGPARMKRWVPSPPGIGLSFILPASNCYTFFLGALIAEILDRRWKAISKRYTVAAASGLIAGESVMGVMVALHTAMGSGH
jgi:OPT family oligopeptide transporter